MYEDLFNKLQSRNALEENIQSVCEGLSWEKIARRLYQITEGEELASGFRSFIRKIQQRKCSLTRRVEEVVATAGLGELETKMKEYYKDSLNGPLTKSGAGAEENWKKFWLLTDGTIIPVEYIHAYSVEDATEKHEWDLQMEGAISGYVIEEEGELGLRGLADKFTSDQISTLRKMYKEYPIEKVYSDVFSDEMDRLYSVPSSRDFSNFLRYGKGRTKREWESIDEEVATALSEPEQKLKDRYTPYPEARLEKSTYFGGGEKDWRKFWLLTDGTIIPVKFAHGDSAQDAGIDYSRDLYNEGAVAGYVNDTNAEMGLRGNVFTELSPEQILAAKKLYNDFPGIETIYANMLEEEGVGNYVPTASALTQFLRAGIARERKPWESVNENLSAFAKYELDLAGMFDKDSDYEGMLGEAVMDLIELFASQGHSGYSAQMTMELFDKLARFKPLTELTDNPKEWMLIADEQSHSDSPLWQSRRCPSCFSENEGKTYYDIDEMEEGQTHDDGHKMHTSKHWEKNGISE